MVIDDTDRERRAEGERKRREWALMDPWNRKRLI
jgi:hypothetical protein